MSSSLMTGSGCTGSRLGDGLKPPEAAAKWIRGPRRGLVVGHNRAGDEHVALVQAFEHFGVRAVTDADLDLCRLKFRVGVRGRFFATGQNINGACLRPLAARTSAATAR